MVDAPLDDITTLCRLCGKIDQRESLVNLYVGSRSAKLQRMLRATCPFLRRGRNELLPAGICERCRQDLKQAYDFQRQCKMAEAMLWDLFMQPAGSRPRRVRRMALGLEQEPEETAVSERATTNPDASRTDKTVSEKCPAAAEGEYSEAQQQELPPEDAFLPPATAKDEREEMVVPPCKMEPDHPPKTEVQDLPDNGPKLQIELLAPHGKAAKWQAKDTDGDRPFECQTCNRRFKRKMRLEAHVLLHLGIRRHECPKCQRRYVTKQSLKLHLENIHSESFNYFCATCGKGFMKEALLRTHGIVHSAERKFVCPNCQKTYKTLGQLKLHQNVHLPPGQRRIRQRQQTPKSFVCPYCGKVSMSTNTNTMHIRTHTLDQRYECNVCQRRFTSSGSLNKHLRVHSGEKPFQCEHCKLTFRQRHHMTTHVRAVHMQVKPYPCMMCDKSFATRGNLSNHLRRHSGKPTD